MLRGTYRPGDDLSRDALLDSAPAVHQIWIASVAGAEAEHALADMLARRWGVQPWFAGAQRAVARCITVTGNPSAWVWIAGSPCLPPGGGYRAGVCVVDAGSALTVDLLSDSGHHEGGYIIPAPR